MGLLKHVICPFFAVTHASAVWYALQSPADFAKAFGMPNEEEKVEENIRETTFLVCLGAFHAASSFLFTVGSFWETAHVRGMIVAYEAVFCGACVLLGAGPHKLPLKDMYPPMGFFALSLGSLIIHAMEPGIFTKDKSTSAK
eukprot:scaffold37030_cov199-Amphora_coffeaeformis.AAC.2